MLRLLNRLVYYFSEEVNMLRLLNRLVYYFSEEVNILSQ